MKQLLSGETSMVLLIALLASYLVFAPIVIDINLAQSEDAIPPILSHHPVKMGYRSKPLKITARIWDNTSIKSVTITIKYAGKSSTGNVPPREGFAEVPVMIQAIQDLDIRSGPGQQYKLNGKVRSGEQLNVTGTKGDYYRVKSAFNVMGYVKAADTRIIMKGKIYGVALPETITSEPEISYQIKVTDASDNTTTSEIFHVMLLTDEDIEAMIAKRGISKKSLQQADVTLPKEKKTKKRQVSTWIFAGLALIGGGAYYYLSQEKDENAINVNITLETD